MGRHFVPGFNQGDYSLLSNLMNNPAVTKTITYAETSDPGFVGAISAADKAILLDDTDFKASSDNAMNTDAVIADFIHVDLGAVYAVSHIRWALKMLVDGSGSYNSTIDVSSDNFVADTLNLKTTVERAGAKENYIWQVNHNIRYLRLRMTVAMSGTRTLAWYPLSIYGNSKQL